MNGRQRRKFFAGAGIISIFLGALMLFAPMGAGAQQPEGVGQGSNNGGGGSSGNEDCDSLADGATLAKYEGNVTDGGEYQATGAFLVDFTATAIDDDPSTDAIEKGFVFDFESDGTLVSLVFVKQASDNQGLSQAYPIAPPDDAGSVEYTLSNGISHITFCSGQLPPTCPTGSTHVDGNDNGLVDEGECDYCPNMTGVQAAGTNCNPPTCPTGSTHVDGNDNGLVDEGECDYCPNMTGVQAAGTNCNPVPPCTSNCGPVVLDECPNLDGIQAPGTDCNPVVITDVCPEIPGRQTLIESCVEVLPNEEEPPPVVTPPVEVPPTPPAATPTPAVRPNAVLGVQTVRSLPRTGDETRSLAGVGALMLAMGAAMVLASKRQLSR